MPITISIETESASNKFIIFGNEDLHARLIEGLGNTVNKGKLPLYSGFSVGFLTLFLNDYRIINCDVQNCVRFWRHSNEKPGE